MSSEQTEKTEPEVTQPDQSGFVVKFTTRSGDFQNASLGLLWKLIESYEVDIFEVSLSRITQDFIHYIEILKPGLEEEADFAVMAARLIYYKSKMLLPNPGFEDDYEPDALPPELVEQLLEYKRFQQAAEVLREYEERSRLSFTRQPDWSVFEEDTNFLSVDLLSFLKAYKDFLLRKEREKPMQITEDPVTIEEMMAEISAALELKEQISFFEFCESFGIVRVVTSFMALLEMVKMKLISVKQDVLLEDIFIEKYLHTTQEADSETHAENTLESEKEAHHGDE